MNTYLNENRYITEMDSGLKAAIRDYWNEHIHDLSIASQPIGTAGFFQELDDYRFEKLSYLPRVVDFTSYYGKHLLEVGCGVGIDLMRLAREGAFVTGIDLSDTAIRLAKGYFNQNKIEADLSQMDGEAMKFEEDTFDVVYAHGVLQYTVNPQKMVEEIYRVLKPGGEAIFMVYNRYSWLNLLSKLMKVELEHEDAPIFRKFSIRELRHLLKRFSQVRIVLERFPVQSRLHQGMKGKIYNQIFVKAFYLLPKALVRPTGWHLMAFVVK